MAEGTPPHPPSSTSLRTLVEQTSPPVEESTARIEFGEIRRCKRQIDAVVSEMDKEPVSPKPKTSTPRTSASRANDQEINDWRREVNRWSHGQEKLQQGQEELKQGQEELKECVKDLKNTFGTSKSVGDLTLDMGFTSSDFHGMRSRGLSFSGYRSPTSGTASEFGDFSSAYSSSSCVANLEACLTRELLKKMETQMGRLELQGQQISDEMKSLAARVQQLWSLSSDSVSRSPSLPPHITAFCHKIVDVIHKRVYDLARHLDVFEHFVIRGSYRNVFWRVIGRWSTDCRDRGTVPLLETLIHACQECEVPHPLDIEPMPMGDRRVLERNYSFLAEHLIVPIVLTYLRDSAMLTTDLVRYVLDPEPRPEKVTRLIDIMTVFGKYALHLFKEALRSSGQGHIVDGLIYEDEALDPAETVTAVPDAPVRLRESLKYQLGDISALVEQVHRVNELCKLSSGSYWAGMFLNMEVSVKVPSSSRDAVLTMMEVNQLRRLNHKHVLQLVGVVRHASPPWIICESVQGDLLTHIRGLQGKRVSFSRIHNMALQISKGMEYMESKQCIHGDLTAENVLVLHDGRTLKVANFLVIPPESLMDADSTGHVLTSVRWSSPETLVKNTKSTKSDVWAYGVVLWELCTLGLVPYPNMSLEDVKKSVKCGHVMPRPQTEFSLPDSTYDVMVSCWKFFPSDRPAFCQIESLLTGARSREPKPSDSTEAHGHRLRRRSSLVRRSSTTRPKSYHFEPDDRSRVTSTENDKQQLEVKKKKKNFFQKISMKRKDKTKGSTSCFYAALDGENDSKWKPA